MARRIADERGLDLGQIAGSGPEGRIIKRDVESAASAPAAAPALVASGFQDVALSQMRKAIARRLVQSIGPIPTFYLTAEVDMERAAEARARKIAREILGALEPARVERDHLGRRLILSPQGEPVVEDGA